LSRLIVVSNRVNPPQRRGEAPAGGLAVALAAALREYSGFWFGWSGQTTDTFTGEMTTRRVDDVTVVTVDLDEADYQEYYNGYANGALWPLFHYRIDLTAYDRSFGAGYERVNRRFAETLAPLIEPGDLIWVHDYHLIPLAQKLRALGQSQPMGFFLHVPFPHFEVLRALPTFTEILQALLEYDLVGFQTETDRHSFLGAVTTVWGSAAVADTTVTLGERRVRTGVFPIGVDVQAIAQSAAGALATLPVQRMVQGLVGRRLIIGVDRLDHSKGLLERFRAYRHFLESFPEQSGQVTYLQIAPLGRQSVEAYKRIRDSLEQSSGRTNGRFADADWTPIRYLNRNFPHATLMGFLRAAQVCLVTPVRDGMNLVAKEFVAAQDFDDPGVLILSNRAGAACELSDALLINPYDTNGIARAIQAALTMPLAERRARHAKLLATLRENDIHRWHTRFVESLRARSSPAAGDALPSE